MKKGKKEKVFAATTQASKDTPRKEKSRFPAMTKASRDTQTRKREKKGKRKEREGKEKEVDRCSQLRASVQGHTREG